MALSFLYISCFFSSFHTKLLFCSLFFQGLLVVVACWTITELLSGVLRASPDASHLNIDIYIYL